MCDIKFDKYTLFWLLSSTYVYLEKQDFDNINTSQKLDLCNYANDFHISVTTLALNIYREFSQKSNLWLYK